MYKKKPIKNIDFIHDYYHFLGVDKDVDSQNLKKAYLKKSKEYHPDKVSHLGKDIQDVSNRIYPLIIEGYKILSDDTLRKVYNDNLDLFKKDKPGLIDTEGYALLDLTQEIFDLDFLLSDNDEYEGQSSFRSKYQQMCGFHEESFKIIENAYKLDPTNEQIKKAYFDQMTAKNVYLNMKEMEVYMSAGILNKKEVKSVGVLEYVKETENELVKVRDQLQLNVDVRLISADTQPILIGLDQKDVSKDLVVAKDEIALKLNESFSKKKEKIIEVATEKQNFLKEYVKLRNYKNLNEKSDSKNVEVIVVLKNKIICNCIVNYQDGEYAPLNIAYDYNEELEDQIKLKNNNRVFLLEWNNEIPFTIFVVEFINDVINGDL